MKILFSSLRFILGFSIVMALDNPNKSAPPKSTVVANVSTKVFNKNDSGVSEFLSIYDELYRNDDISKSLKNQAKDLSVNNQKDEFDAIKEKFKNRQEHLLNLAKDMAKLSDALFATYSRAHELDFGNIANINASKDKSKPKKVKEKLADNPKDMPLKVKLHTGDKYCFTPVWTKGEGYLYLENCSYAKPSRYDVFGRIAWNNNNTWLCLTAPSSVTGIEGKSTESWDYMLLRPCSINDANQRFIIKDGGIYTEDHRFRIKDYGWYAYISKKKDDYYDHVLSNMDIWQKTIARPGTITTKTFAGWLFVDRFQWAIYYLQNNRSYADVIEWLYYNPENGHISQYYPQSGDIYCMTSNAKPKEDWNWVSWNKCDDSFSITKKDSRLDINTAVVKDNKSWSFFELVENEGYLQDYLGNMLRISEYGSNWGVPWVGSLDYIQYKENKTNVPKSLFLFSQSIPYWERYVNGNLGQTLEYCPAPGSSSKANLEKKLPPSFTLTPQWIQRLYEVAVTAPQTSTTIGICGTCLLHSYEMVAQMMANQFGGPPTGRGIFFDLARGSDPAVSFTSRYPLLSERLSASRAFADRQYSPDEDLGTRTRRILYGVSTTILPEYDWHSYELINGDASLDALVDRMLRSPVGTLWVSAMSRSNPTGGISGHVQPILRTNDGIVLIPTNANVSFQQFSGLLAPVTDGAAMRNYLTDGGTRTMYTFALIEITNAHVDRADRYFSNHSCRGSGAHRRGTGQFPMSSTINQCTGGRCLIQ